VRETQHHTADNSIKGIYTTKFVFEGTDVITNNREKTAKDKNFWKAKNTPPENQKNSIIESQVEGRPSPKENERI